MDILRIISVKIEWKNQDKHFKAADCLFRRIKPVSFLFIAFLAMVSCEDFFISEVTNVEIPGSESKLVVYSYISPQDSVLRVHVSRSIPYYSTVKEEAIMGQVIVSLSRQGGERKILEYDQNYRCFVIRSEMFKVEPGLFYNLSVELESGERVDAECYVPELEFDKIEAEALKAETDEWGNEYTSIDWKITTRNNGQANYYSSGAYVSSYRTTSYNGLTESFIYHQDLWLEKGSQYIFDESGRTWSFKAGHWGSDYFYLPGDYDYTQGMPDIQSVDSIFVYVMQTDENYYLFHRSYDNYNYYGDDFPFAESVIIYSNIDGGLGVFAGYNRKNIYVPVPDRNDD